jgi:hypothetical protein
MKQDHKRRLAKASNELIALRNDGTKTAARYDEIIKLRMFILDIEAAMRQRGDERDEEQLRKIDKLAQFWGAKGDCV